MSLTVLEIISVNLLAYLIIPWSIYETLGTIEVKYSKNLKSTHACKSMFQFLILMGSSEPLEAPVFWWEDSLHLSVLPLPVCHSVFCPQSAVHHLHLHCCHCAGSGSSLLCSQQHSRWTDWPEVLFKHMFLHGKDNSVQSFASLALWYYNLNFQQYFFNALLITEHAYERQYDFSLHYIL